MRMNEIRFDGQPPVDSYAPGGFRIAGEWHDGSLILMPGGLLPVDGVLAVETLAPLVEAAAGIDVVLLGMGAEIRPLARPLRAALEGAGLGVEIMSTPSACRTYNVLLAEERRVAAVLIAV